MFRILMVVTILALIAYAIWGYKRIQDAAWAEARLNPMWEVREFTLSGCTYVTLALMAHHGGRSEKFGSVDKIGVADIKEADWQLQLEQLRIEANGRAAVLNEARTRLAAELEE
jgi:hypothetical protein